MNDTYNINVNISNAPASLTGDHDNTPPAGYDHWEDHTRYSPDDWKYEVANGDTRTGYWTWVKNKIDDE